MRSLTVLGALAAVGAAHASFELVMVADRGTKSVHRYDGNSGVYLGQFGNGYLQNPMSISLDQANNRVFVADQVGTGDGSLPGNVRIWSFNYNTGEYLSNFRVNFNYVQPQITYLNGVLSIGHENALYDRFNALGGWLGTYTWSGATNPKGLAVDETGNYWAVEGNKVYSRATTGVQSTYTMVNSVSSSGVGGQRQLVVSGSRALAVGAISFSTINLSLLSTSNTANTLMSPTTSFNQVNGAGFGHGDIAYICGVNGSVGQVSRILYSEAITLQSFGSGQLVEPRSIAVVNAPEPGSLATLGLGVAALIKRRRRRGPRKATAIRSSR